MQSKIVSKIGITAKQKAYVYIEGVGNRNNKTQNTTDKRKGLYHAYRKTRKFIIKVNKYNKRN